MPEPPEREVSRRQGLLAALRAEGGHLVWLGWRLFWKVTVVAAVALFLLFLAFHNDDFREFDAQTIFGAAVVFGYCVMCAAGAGIAAAAFAIAWRLWGAWILVPVLGALFGAIGLVALGLVLLSALDLNPAAAGVHGGGQVAAALLLAGAAMLGAIGAAAGAIGGVLLAGLLGVSARNRRSLSRARLDRST